MPQQPQVGDDVTALMGGAPSGGPAPQVGDDVTHLFTDQGLPVYRTQNNPPDWTELAGIAGQHVLQGINPLPLLKDVADHWDPWSDPASNIGKAAFRLGINVGKAHYGLLKQSIDLFNKARETQSGVDLADALTHFAAALVPVIGPGMARAGEQIGHGLGSGDLRDAAAGVGDTLGIVGPMVVGAVAPKLKVPGLTPANPVDAAAVAWAEREGVPLSAAAATGGNTFVQGIQTLADRSIPGAVIAPRAAQASAEGLAAAGRRVATDIYPDPVTPEQAATLARGDVTRQIRTLHKEAATEYGKVEAASQLPENLDPVPRQPTAQELADAAALKKTRRPYQQDSLGYVPKDDQLAELRRIQEELDTFQFTKHTFTPVERGRGQAYDVASGSPNAAVLQDIVGEFKDLTGRKTAPQASVFRQAVESALRTGYYTNEAKAALNIAKARLAGEPGLAAPWLPPEAGAAAAPMEDLPLAVDMRPYKTALDPVRAELQAAHDIAPLQGAQAGALRTLTSIVEGPDYAPLLAADKARSNLLAAARTAKKMSTLKTPAEAIALKAAGALDDAIQARAATAAGDVAESLRLGRAFTREKFNVQGVARQMRDEDVRGLRSAEPLRFYNQALRGENIGLLRDLAKIAPDAPARIGRAMLDASIDRLTQRGGLSMVGEEAARWERLPPATKELIVPDAAHREAITNFYTVARRLIAEPNPSGTAHQAILTTQAGTLVFNPSLGIPLQITGGLVSKLLHSTAGVRLLTRGLTMPTRSAAAAGLIDDLVQAMRASQAAPTAAQEQERRQTPTGAAVRR